MKSTKTCPKCQGREIIFIPQLADRDDKDVVRPFVVHVVHYDWRDDMEMGVVRAYICRKCGYTELYTADARALPVEKIPGAKLIRDGVIVED
jgi:predicted nucleic-acid-binding Zn-ribbon protein